MQGLVSYVNKKEAPNIFKAHKAEMKTTMKWFPFVSTFIMDKICELVKSSVQTDRRTKEVH
jgi:hypothetical protein